METVVSQILSADTNGAASHVSNAAAGEHQSETSRSASPSFCKWRKGRTVWRPSQGMCSLYKSRDQAHYTWHYDNEVDQTTRRWRNFRVLTCILYLNQLPRGKDRRTEWRREDGGHLECEVESRTISTDKSTTSTSTVTIAPSGGTLVLFDSCSIRHRVLPTNRDRFALTQWFVSPEFLASKETAPQGHRLRGVGRKKNDEAREFLRKKRPSATEMNSHNETAKRKPPHAHNDKQQSISYCHWPEGNHHCNPVERQVNVSGDEETGGAKSAGFSFNFLGE
mmetsp:Transcript_29208/g.80248  ORF Transcript_29208/g.80248 Transcript_29208/m.80248 type:complete len:280 (-) Transcript_29208:49-888(-)